MLSSSLPGRLRQRIRVLGGTIGGLVLLSVLTSGWNGGFTVAEFAFQTWALVLFMAPVCYVALFGPDVDSNRSTVCERYNLPRVIAYGVLVFVIILWGWIFFARPEFLVPIIATFSRSLSVRSAVPTECFECTCLLLLVWMPLYVWAALVVWLGRMVRARSRQQEGPLGP